MEHNPKVSVIMSVYNGEKYLKQSIDSILCQSYSNFEYIIINDGSNDNTKKILESIDDSRVKIIHQKNIGLTASLNNAILLSKGEYIARQDADDVSLFDRLEKQVKYFEDNKDYILVGSNSFLINEFNEHIGVYKLPKTDTEIRWTILFRNPLCHSTIMIRSDIIRNEGILYNEYLKTAQDFDFLYRIIKYGKSGNIENPLVEYRVHPDQIGKLYYAEQQKNALLISHSHLVNIGFNMSEDEVKRLRKWAYEFPSSIRKEDIYACNLLLRVLKEFKRQPFVDSNNLINIKNDYISKICNAINMGNIFDVLLSTLLVHVIYENGLICLKNFSGRAISKIVS